MMMKIPIQLLILFFCSFPIVAANYDAPWKGELYRENNDIQASWARAFIDELPTNASDILDLGCGDGKLTCKLAKKAGHAAVHGLDLSANQISAAKKLIDGDLEGRLSFSVGDAADFQLDQTFDLIFSNAAMHWVENQDGVISCASKHLRPGGMLYFLIPAKADLFKQLKDTRSQMISSTKYAEYLKNYKPRTFSHSIDDYLPRLLNFGLTIQEILLKPRHNVFDSKIQFANWVSAWLFSLFSEIPQHLQSEFLADFVNTYMAQPGSVDQDGKIHYYGYLLKIVATKNELEAK